MKGLVNGPTLVDYSERFEKARIIYEDRCETDDLKKLIKKYQISYVVWNKGVKWEYKKADNYNLENKEVFNKAYNDSTLTVYRVI